MIFTIKATSDIFFKYLLGSEENKDLLLSFLNAVLVDSEFSSLSTEIFGVDTDLLRSIWFSTLHSTEKVPILISMTVSQTLIRKRNV